MFTVHIDVEKTAPAAHVRHAHYTPARHSITLLDPAALDSIYVSGTPGQLHAFGLAVVAAADQAARVEAAAVRMDGPLLNGKPVEPATDEEFVGL